MASVPYASLRYLSAKSVLIMGAVSSVLPALLVTNLRSVIRAFLVAMAVLPTRHVLDAALSTSLMVATAT